MFHRQITPLVSASASRVTTGWTALYMRHYRIPIHLPSPALPRRQWESLEEVATKKAVTKTASSSLFVYSSYNWSSTFVNNEK